MGVPCHRGAERQPVGGVDQNPPLHRRRHRDNPDVGGVQRRRRGRGYLRHRNSRRQVGAARAGSTQDDLEPIELGECDCAERARRGRDGRTRGGWCGRTDGQPAQPGAGIVPERSRHDVATLQRGPGAVGRPARGQSSVWRDAQRCGAGGDQRQLPRGLARPRRTARPQLASHACSGFGSHGQPFQYHRQPGLGDAAISSSRRGGPRAAARAGAQPAHPGQGQWSGRPKASRSRSRRGRFAR